MADYEHDVVKNGISQIRYKVKNELSVPFLKTCPHCNTPLRANETISVALQAVTPRDFTSFRYFCKEHKPTPSDLTDRTLISYGIIVDFQIVEPSPDCDASKRNISVENVEYQLPPSYNI